MLLLVSSVQAQINGVVLDSITNEPLVYANVILQTQQIGVATNYKGVFQINNKNNLESDTLLVSHVGYKSKRIVVSHIKKDSVYKFYLKEDLNLLDEVVIKSSKKLSKTKYKIKTKRKKLVGHNLKYNEELVKYIDNKKNTPGKLLKVTFYLRNYKIFFGTKLPVHYRLRLYHIDTISKKPKDLVLLKRDIVIKPENKKQNFELDLTNYNIKFPKEGLYVGLQSINPSLIQPKKGLFYEITPLPVQSHVKKTSSFFRDLGGKWHSFEHLGSLKKNHHKDLIIDVELKYYEK